MLSNFEINELTKNSVDPDAELILLLNSIEDHIKKLTTRVTKLEAQQKCLEVWQPGQSNAWRPLAERDGRDAST
jgi:hypothetical protein